MHSSAMTPCSHDFCVTSLYIYSNIYIYSSLTYVMGVWFLDSELCCLLRFIIDICHIYIVINLIVYVFVYIYRIHSAGHLLDSAFINLGWTVKELEPIKVHDVYCYLACIVIDTCMLPRLNPVKGQSKAFKMWSFKVFYKIYF